MKYFLLLLFGIGSFSAFASDSLYNPKANARADISKASAKARSEKKHILIQAGGNWCGWCIEFNRFVHADKKIDSIMNSSFIVYHLNYSPQNTNYEVFQQYGFPVRFGFPVFLVLNGEGQLIHTQNSSYLELGRSYDAEKVKEFLLGWTPAAFDESNYVWMKK
ncbi:MAG: thioredoxin family protein [Bacteroidota bacterium]